LVVGFGHPAANTKPLQADKRIADTTVPPAGVT